MNKLSYRQLTGVEVGCTGVVIGLVALASRSVLALNGSPNFTLAPFSGRSVAASGAPPPGSSVVECACVSNLFVDDAQALISTPAEDDIGGSAVCLPTATITLLPGTFVGGNISVQFVLSCWASGRGY